MKTLTKHGLTLAFLWMVLMLILHGCSEEPKTSDKQPIDFRPNIETDSVEYKQHPCDYKCKSHWE